jgi:hypothetical protein
MLRRVATVAAVVAVVVATCVLLIGTPRRRGFRNLPGKGARRKNCRISVKEIQ